MNARRVLQGRWRRRRRERGDPRDVSSLAEVRDPIATFEALRTHGPVVRLSHVGCTVVLGHREARWVLTHPDDFSSEPFAGIDAVLLGADPPEHGVAREVVGTILTLERVESLIAIGAELAAEIARPGARFDAVEGFARRIPEAVARDLVGLEPTDVEQLRELGRAGIHESHPDLDAVIGRSTVIADLLDAGASRVDRDAAISIARLLWLASTTTSQRLIANAADRLLDPHLAASLRTDEALVDDFLAEVLRLHPPEHIIRRRARHRSRLGEVDIDAGEDVHVCVTAANRDPAAHEEPHEVRLGRGGATPLTFGAGPHHCIGAPIARGVARAAIVALLRGGDLRADADEDGARRIDTFWTSALLRLPVAL